MTAIKIEGAGYTLGNIFSDAFLFNIPNYQRPYAWTIDQTEQLLNDILEAIGNESTDVGEISPYFLGNIVLIKPTGKSESEVVDGQQRLTTLTILFSVLRELLNDEGLTKYIFQPEDKFAGIPARPRLRLRKRDQYFFEEYIQNSNGIKKISSIFPGKLSDSQRNILENTSLLRKKIADDLPTEVEKLRLTQFILQRCYLVAVHTPDFDSAYRIFSVLNDRGLDLSVTDILKADVIGKFYQINDLSESAKATIEKKYTRKWEDLEEQLGRKDFEDLFSRIRIIYAEKKLEATLVKSFRTHVLNKEENKDPRYFIDKVLEPYAQALYDIKNCTFISKTNQQKINQLFRWLQRIDHFDWVAPAILYLNKYRHYPDKLLTFYTYLERLAVGLMIQRTRSSQRINRYFKITQMIKENSDLLYAYDSPLQLTSEEQQEIIKLLNGDIYNKYKVRSIRIYILLRLDSYISDGIPNYDSYKKITVEHILPQTPKSDSQWLKWFPIKQEREKYLHSLSNLVLLSRQKNSRASNYDFKVKKEKYFNSSVTTFALTVQVLKEEEWTPEILETRQRYLLEQLKQIWQLNSF